MKTILRVAVPLLATAILWPGAASAQRHDPNKGMKKLDLQNVVTSYWRMAASQEEEAKKPGHPYFRDDSHRKDLDKEVDKCKAAVDVAYQQGLAPEDTIEVDSNGTFTTMPIGEVNARICDRFREACLKVWEKDKEAYEAQFKPWKDVLTGDKWKVWYDGGFINLTPRGAGGTVLDTPQALAKSNTWCETLGDENDPFHPTRKVRCWHFKGDRQAGPPVEKTGNGRNPPNGVYK